MSRHVFSSKIQQQNCDELCVQNGCYKWYCCHSGTNLIEDIESDNGGECKTLGKSQIW